MQTVNVSIKGIAPLLQHKMPEEDVNASVRRTSDKQGDNPEDFLYMCGKKICQPATHIERAIVQAASGFRWSAAERKHTRTRRSASSFRRT